MLAAEEATHGADFLMNFFIVAAIVPSVLEA